MSKRIDRAIAAYQANTGPEVVREVVARLKRGTRKGFITAVVIRNGQLLRLQEAIDAELNR
jgi:hypothetical protein